MGSLRPPPLPPWPYFRSKVEFLRGEDMDDPISALLIECRYTEALPLVLESLALARMEGPPEAIFDSLDNLWLIYSESGQPDKAIAVLEEEVALCRHHGPRELYPRSLRNLAATLAGAGRKGEALACLRRTQRLLRRQKNLAELCDTLCQEARVLLELGHPKEAEARLRCAPAWPPDEPRGFPHDTPLRLGRVLSNCLEQQGRLAEAADALQSALAAARGGSRFTYVEDLHRLGRLYTRLNYKWEAQVCFREALRCLEGTGSSPSIQALNADLRALAARFTNPTRHRTDTNVLYPVIPRGHRN